MPEWIALAIAYFVPLCVPSKHHGICFSFAFLSHSRALFASFEFKLFVFALLLLPVRWGGGGSDAAMLLPLQRQSYSKTIPELLNDDVKILFICLFLHCFVKKSEHVWCESIRCAVFCVCLSLIPILQFLHFIWTFCPTHQLCSRMAESKERAKPFRMNRIAEKRTKNKWGKNARSRNRESNDINDANKHIQAIDRSFCEFILSFDKLCIYVNEIMRINIHFGICFVYVCWFCCC